LFIAGLVLLAFALVFPLGSLSTQYFSARIVQHMLIVASIPSLLLLANPVRALWLGLPDRWQVRLAEKPRDTRRLGPGRRFIHWATAPGVTLLAFLCTCWLWYDPLFNAATLRFSVIHVIELASLFVLGLLNWWHITGAWPRTHGIMTPALRVVYAFIGIWPVKLIGLALLFTSQQLYDFPATFKFSGLQINDYSFGAMIAWIVSGLAYAVATISLAQYWLGPEGDKPALPESVWGTEEMMLAPGMKREVQP
jgi:cytochrome c oxidase assembly factor CtaG